MRHSVLGLLGLVLSVFSAVAQTSPPREVVVAIRYLQATGTSYSHLYLYREDGKLLRQLTKDNSGQDFDPVFAPDGASIVFSRDKAQGAVEFWSTDPFGKAAKQLEAAPEWYSTMKTSPYFGGFEPEGEASPAAAADTAGDEPAADPPRTYRAPDGSIELVVQRLPSDDEETADGEGLGKHSLLRDVKSGQETELGTLPGFYGIWDVLRLKGNPERVYLFDGPMRLAFFSLHLNSTDGDATFALDLAGRRFVQLSRNGAAPIPLPGQAAFLTMSYTRYVPIPGSKKTANCSYLELWDERLSKVRFARAGTAAICYGASMYRPQNQPAIITLRRDAE